MRRGGSRYASGNITRDRIFLVVLGLNFSRFVVTSTWLEKQKTHRQCRASSPRRQAIDERGLDRGRQIGKIHDKQNRPFPPQIPQDRACRRGGGRRRATVRQGRRIHHAVDDDAGQGLQRATACRRRHEAGSSACSGPPGISPGTGIVAHAAGNAGRHHHPQRACITSAITMACPISIPPRTGS